MFSFATSTYPWFRGGFTPLTESETTFGAFQGYRGNSQRGLPTI